MIDRGRVVAPERSAREIFTRLLRTTPRACLRSDDFDNELTKTLEKFRPRLRRGIMVPSVPRGNHDHH